MALSSRVRSSALSSKTAIRSKALSGRSNTEVTFLLYRRECTGFNGYRTYQDTEWGFPVDDERRLFEKICLEGFQSGLSWLTILNKRGNFLAAFSNFDSEQLAAFDKADVKRRLLDARIVRHCGNIA